MLAQVVHDWPGPDAERILRRCADAVNRPAAWFSWNACSPTSHSRPEHAAMDLRMLNLFGDKERSRDEFEALASAAGLRLEEIRPGGGGLSLVVLARDPG